MTGTDAFSAELRRKLFHMLSLLYLGAYEVLGPERGLRWLAVWGAALAVVEFSRLASPAVRGLFDAVFGPLIRPKEASRVTGAFYTTLGVIVAVYLFGGSPTLVRVSVLYLAFGDAAGAVVGVGWGRRRFTVLGQTRSAEGTAAGFAAAAACGWLVGLGPVALAAGAAAFAVVDAVPLPPDDNLWIPLLPTGAVWLAGGGA